MWPLTLSVFGNKMNLNLTPFQCWFRSKERERIRVSIEMKSNEPFIPILSLSNDFCLCYNEMSGVFVVSICSLFCVSFFIEIISAPLCPQNYVPMKWMNKDNEWQSPTPRTLSIELKLQSGSLSVFFLPELYPEFKCVSTPYTMSCLVSFYEYTSM